MKKIFYSLLMLALLLTLVGCETHEHSYSEEVIEATCTEGGYTKYTCECGDTYNDNVVEAKGHSYGDWTVVKEATEDEEGLKEKLCSVCNDKVTETIPTLEHTHKYTDNVVEATCTEDGYTEHICACGDKYTDSEVKAGHTEEVLPAKAATCTEEGLTEGKKCSACGEVLIEQTTIPAKAHTEEVLPAKAATCAEEGLTEGKKCSACGEVLVPQSTIEALEHKYGEWVVVKDSTTTQYGTKEKTCSTCNNKITEEIPLKADPNENKTYTSITLNNKTYSTLAAAIEAAKDNDIIYLPAGTYSDAVTINKAVIIKGSNVGVNPNTSSRKAESVFTNVITIEASNVTIDGIALSEGGQINTIESATIKNIKLKNINAYNIAKNSTWTDSAKDYTQDYVINFVTSTYGNIDNIEIANCKFDIREGAIKVGRCKNVNIVGNTFKNFENAAVRVEGGYTGGTYNINDNKFENDKMQGYAGIYFSSYGADTTSITINIDNNVFKNIGATEGTYIGGICAKSYQEKGAKWTIANNTFENCYNSMKIRNNASASNHSNYPWSLKASNNTYVGVPQGVYFTCRANSDAASTNPALAEFTSNTFKDANGNKITPDESKLLNLAETPNEEDGYLLGQFDGNSWVVKGQNIQLSTTYVHSSLGQLSWKSNTPEIATVTSSGTVKGVSEGVAEIVVYDPKNEEISFTFYVTVFNENPTGILEFLVNNNNATVFTKNNLIIGILNQSPAPYYTNIVGGVSNILFEDYKVNMGNYIDDPKSNRRTTLVGVGKGGVDFITLHYAADMPAASTSLKGGSNLSSYNKQLNDNGTSTSWHYSVGNDGVWYCQNTAYGTNHAGSSKTMTWYKTGVKVSQIGTNIYTTDVTLGSDGYFYLKGIKTSVKNETGYSKLNGMGLGVKIVDDEWYISGCYYNSSYGFIAAVGGNNNSIGIETSVREGSDLWLTWQYSAQLCASLLIEFELPIQRLVGHHFFSGKWCPQPMIENDLEIWYEFVDMVESEMELFTTYKDYDLEFSSNSKYLGSNGRFTSQPFYSQCVTYTIDYTINGQTKSVTLSSIVPGTIK